MSTYRAFEVTGPRAFTLATREVPEAPAGHVRIRVEACGICHSDAATVESPRDSSQPVVPGHEIVGVIDAVGAGVNTWQVGDRVGVGFLAGQCGECDHCRRGDFVNCAAQPYTGLTTDGGYAEVVVARSNGLVRVPEGMPAVEAAPLLCAGLTVVSALNQIGVRPGGLVAVQGIGGLGHLGVQYAHRLGYRVVAIARGSEKAKLAAQLGADEYIDSSVQDPAAELQRLGGADAVLATAASAPAMSPLVAGLAPRGRMVVLGLDPTEPLSVSTTELIFGSRTVMGSLTGTSIENEDNLEFCLRRGIHPTVETVPLTEAPEAYARMMSGRARFRMVIDMASAA